MKRMSIVGCVFTAVPLFASPALAQQADPQQSLMDALSLVSGGMLTASAAKPDLTPDGNGFHIRIPLPGVTSPPDAAIVGAATMSGSGVWDITSLTLPASGTLVAAGAANRPPVSIAFSIGHQQAHATVDPTLAQASPYAMEMGDITLRLQSIGAPVDISIGQVSLAGTMTGDADHRMTTRSHVSADNWHLVGADKTGEPVTMSMQSVAMHYDVDGLDRAKAMHLRDLARAFAAERKAMPPPVPGHPVTLSPVLRAQLLKLLDDSEGLLDRVTMQEDIKGVHFEAPHGNAGTIGAMRLGMASQVTGGLVSADMDFGLEALALTSVPVQFAPYVPSRVAFTGLVSGMEAKGLRQWLHAALEHDEEPEVLRAQAMALLNAPGAKVGIEHLSMQSGPLLIEGSAQVKPLPDGTVGYEIHLTARGLDAMLARVQTDPQAQKVLPMLFLAKGMGKQVGDRVIWDISIAHGVTTVNGVALGGPGKRH